MVRVLTALYLNTIYAYISQIITNCWILSLYDSTRSCPPVIPNVCEEIVGRLKIIIYEVFESDDDDYVITDQLRAQYSTRRRSGQSVSTLWVSTVQQLRHIVLAHRTLDSTAPTDIRFSDYRWLIAMSLQMTPCSEQHWPLSETQLP